MTRRKLLTGLFLHLFLIGGAVFSVLPFGWMLSTSLKTPQEINQTTPTIFPVSPQWQNYPQAIERYSATGVSFTRCFLNSAFVALAVTLGVLVTSVLTAYTFSMMNFPGKNIVFIFFLMPMMIPFEVILIPNFILIQKIGDFIPFLGYDTYAALIIPWIANVFSIFFLRRIFERIPREIYEAAKVDGCGDLRFLWSMAIPMAKPALITIGLYTFLGSWNAFLWPLVATSSPELSVIQKGLSSFMQEAGTDYHLLMAAATLTILPVVILYLFAQRWFHEGANLG
ncbi:MAG: carbohydrate ABC transporter permease [Phycisphaerae bacterium]|jgi:multiple sugar transport system permease protein|nr:carbohydrate ABC transporter permease [Phycisphaerae bacterium]